MAVADGPLSVDRVANFTLRGVRLGLADLASYPLGVWWEP